MRLISVTLKGFRCYANEVTIPIGETTALIGRNDVGKSSVLHALEIFFNNVTVKLDSEDCYVKSPDQSIEITCEFADLPPRLVLDATAETTLKAEYLLTAEDTLRIKKRYGCAGAKPKEEVFVCAFHPTAAGYADLLTLTNAGLKKRLKDLSIDTTGVQQNSNPSLRRAIWDSATDLQLGACEIPVAKEDAKAIWDKLNEYLPLFALFQSDRPSQDTDAEVQDPMKLAISTALSEPGIRSKLDEIVSAIRESAVELAQRTHAALGKIDPNLAEELSPEFRSDPKWGNLFSVTLKSDQGIPVNKRGSGVRRLILVSFFRAEAERRRTETGAGSIIYAIEEPETSQHPRNQRILVESFGQLVLDEGCQIIVTTHSPGFASYLPAASLRFIRRDSDNQPSITAGEDVSWVDLVNTLGVVPDSRVKVLLCVEGVTDVTDFQHLSRALHADDPAIPDLTDEPRVAFVVLGGGNLVHWVNGHYLRELGRPEVHIYDGDVATYAKSIAEVNQRNDGSWGALTRKRQIENYLHPDAIRAGLRLDVQVTDVCDVPEIVRLAKGWSRNTAKQHLSQWAFPEMTAARLRERDPDGEVESWLRRIGEML